MFYRCKGESLVVGRVLATLLVQKEWRRPNIFGTRVVWCGKVCNVILDGGSGENIISKETRGKLKLPTKKHPTPTKLHGFKQEMRYPDDKFTRGDDIEDAACSDVVSMMHVTFYWEGHGYMRIHNLLHHANIYSF